MGRFGCARAVGTVIVLLMGSMAFLSVSPVAAAAPPGWGTATPVEAYGQQWVQGLRTAVDSSGRAFVVWGEADNTHSAVWATRTLDGVHWSKATPIGLPGSGWNLGIAVDENGNAIAVWEQGDVYASRFDTTSGEWEQAARLGSGWDVRIAMGGDGTGFAVWTNEDPVALRDDIWGSQFVVGSGWSNPALIEAEDADDAYSPYVAANSRGEAIAVWAERNDTQARIFASRFMPGMGWEPATRVDTRAYHLFQPRVALDDSGNAIALAGQEESNPAALDIVASRFSRTSESWGSAMTLASGLDAVVDLELQMDPKGNATAAWAQRVASEISTVVRQFDTDNESWGVSMALPGRGSTLAVGASGNAITVRRVDESHLVSNHFYAATGSWGPARTIPAESGEIDGWSVAINGDEYAVTVSRLWRSQEVDVVANRFVRDLGWGFPMVLRKEPAKDAFAPQIEMDTHGNALVVWSQSDGTRTNVWSSQLRAGRSWTTAEMIETGIGEVGRWSVDLAMNSRGEAVAAWLQWDGSYWSIYANRYDPQSGWDAAVRIENLVGNASFPQVAIDPRGVAMTVWTLGDWPDRALMVNRFDHLSASWSPAVAIPDGAKAYSPTLSMDSAGNAIVVWSQSRTKTHPNTDAIMVHRFDAQTRSWGPAVTLESGDLEGGGFHSGHDLAIDAEGNAILVWAGNDGFKSGVFSFRFDVATESWSAAIVAIQEDSTFRWGGHVAFDASGNAIAVWTQVESSIFIWASRLDSSTGSWDRPAQVNQGQEFRNGWFPQVAVDAKGYAIVVWIGGTSNQVRIMANRFDPQSLGWGKAAIIDSLTGDPQFNGPTIAMDEEGNAIAVWAQWDSERYGLFANRFVADTTPPILSLTNPKEGLSVNEPTVTVAGVTEPNATLVINGFVVSVSPDGSFSFPLGLSEGMNEIRATARDEAGNVATASVRVTYQSPIPGLERDLGDLEQDLGDATEALQAADAALASANARSLLLLALQVGFVALSALLFALYWTSRKKGPGSGGILGWPNRSTSPGTARRGRWMRQVRSASLGSQTRTIPSPPWPSRGQMAASPVRLTSKERILIHLLGFTKQGNPAEAPSELTQGGIASLAGVDLRHFSQYIHPLVQEGLVEENAARVQGALKRQKVYVLTEEGRGIALAIRDSVLSTVVSVQEATGLREAPLAEVLAEMPTPRPLLDLVREVIESGIVELRS